MNFYILSLFPEMIVEGLKTSIIGKAIMNKLLSIHGINIREFTKSKHKKVDDYPYGGGAGMLMQAQPIYDAYQSLLTEHITKDTRVIYVTPQGNVFNQEMAVELAKEKDLVFLCGHYEGIDERVLEEVVTDYVSIGDYVLTGGELPVMVMIDAISRMVPGVLNNETSAMEESFHNYLLEHPQYTRPEEWNGKKVPDILLSGHHKKIEDYRMEESIKRTKERRPDLYEKYKKVIAHSTKL
ncbi:MAG: tRNA (guanosine(37)-N1)-methyltransferase TrmD [Lachnospiraceae bacterium]